jgi:hypothetical protein
MKETTKNAQTRSVKETDVMAEFYYEKIQESIRENVLRVITDGKAPKIVILKREQNSKSSLKLSMRSFTPK